MRQIESKSSGIITERVWNEPSPSIRVTYRNLTKVYFRLVRQDWLARLKGGQYRGQWLDRPQRTALLAAKPDLDWSADLPATEDFQQRVEDLPAPKDVKPGFYYLLASHDPNFSNSNNVVSYTDVWVSKLALVVRERNADGQFHGFVLDANSGEPMEGADVQVYAWNWNANVSTGAKAKTDRNGQFSVAGVVGQNNLLYVSHAGEELATSKNLYPQFNNNQPIPYKQVVFFTDRSLYRPGQTIYYKGIAIQVDQEGDNYKVLPNEHVNVVFSGRERQGDRPADAGHERLRFLQRQLHRPPRSADGADDAPRRQYGRATLGCRVEEYKRPKFQVTLDVPKTAARLGGEVQIEGKAIAYTGAAVGGAKIRFRVVRQVRYPDWWYWCYAWRCPTPARRKSPTARPRPGPTETSRSSSSPSPTWRCRRKTSRSSGTRSRPT